MQYLQNLIVFLALLAASVLSNQPIVTYTLKTATDSNIKNTSVGSTSQRIQTSDLLLIESQLKEVRKAIEQGNTAQTSALLNKLITDNTFDCKIKTDFVNQVNELLNKKLKANQQQLQILHTKIPADSSIQTTKKGNLNNQQQIIMLESLKNSLLNKNFEYELKLRENQKKNIIQNVAKYTEAAEEFLSQFRQIRKNNIIVVDASKQQEAIKFLQAELQNNQKFINSALKKRLQLQKNMTNLKLLILSQQMNMRQSQSSTQLQAQYRKYSEKLIQATQKSKQKQIELENLQEELKKKQSSTTSVDYEILQIQKQLENKKSSKSQIAISAFTQANQVFNQNLNIVDHKIKAMSLQCFY